MRWCSRKKKDKWKWNPYFCWMPTEVNNEWVWLEWIERKIVAVMPGIMGDGDVIWKHRNLDPSKSTNNKRTLDQED